MKSDKYGLQMQGIMLYRLESQCGSGAFLHLCFQLHVSAVAREHNLLVCKPSREFLFLVGGKQELDCSSDHLCSC